MYLTKAQTDILNGSEGKTIAKAMEALVRYGELFGATKMVPVKSKYCHLSTSYGMKIFNPVKNSE